MTLCAGRLRTGRLAGLPLAGEPVQRGPCPADRPRHRRVARGFGVLEVPGVTEQADDVSLVHPARKEHPAAGREGSDQERGTRSGELSYSGSRLLTGRVRQTLDAAEVVDERVA